MIRSEYDLYAREVAEAEELERKQANAVIVAAQIVAKTEVKFLRILCGFFLVLVLALLVTEFAGWHLP